MLIFLTVRLYIQRIISEIYNGGHLLPSIKVDWSALRLYFLMLLDP